MEAKVFFNPKAIDFFVNPDTREVYFVKDKAVKPFADISIDDATALRRELERFPAKIAAMEKAGITEPMQQLQTFAACVFGSTHNGPDFVNGKRNNYAMAPCQMRENGQCPFNQVICDKGKLVLKDCTLTRSEVRAIRDAVNDLPEKEAAFIHGLSVNTVRHQKKNTRLKINVKTTAGVAAFGMKYGLY